jgi:uncharacterized protein YkwD
MKAQNHAFGYALSFKKLNHNSYSLLVILISIMKLTSLFQAGVFFLSFTATTALPNPEPHELNKRSSPPPTDATFKANILSYVNSIRSKHAAAPLTWDPTLATFALRKANACKLDHTVS